MSPREQYYLPTRRLVSQDEAAITQRAQVPRSKFVGSWTRKTTFNAGYIVPIMLDELLPGDHMSYGLKAYVRMATPLFPLMDNQRIDTFFFFVPCRLLWANWARFMGEQATPTASIDFTIPISVSPNGGYNAGSIHDHFGLLTENQIGGAANFQHSALPLRAYNLIYNTWFRDQNIIDGIPQNTGDGPDPHTDYTLQRRAKAHDYFSSALPWPQKFTAPSVPLGGLAPITGLGWDNTGATSAGALATVIETASAIAVAPYADWHTDAQKIVMKSLVTGQPQVFADLSEATGVALNTFRQAFLVQTLLERDARGGTRYVELIRSHFGVTNPDYRLQRPEYIGGGQTPIQLTPIAQTAPTEDDPLGALGAAGTGYGEHNASYAATEHGYVIGLINVRTELSYQQGIHKMWNRSTRYDFYWPALAGLGEQAILRKEIYCVGTTAVDDLVFGYQERWHEYRTRYSEITGDFRSMADSPLDTWHLAQYFTSAPVLSEDFIEDIPPMERVLAAGALANGQQYLADLLFNRTAVRPIPTFGTPAGLARF